MGCRLLVAVRDWKEGVGKKDSRCQWGWDCPFFLEERERLLSGKANITTGGSFPSASAEVSSLPPLS